MKVLLSWIFDHIEADWRTVDVPKLVQLFNQTTAEIEHWAPVDLALDTLFLGRIVAQEKDKILVACPELNTQISLPLRTDSVGDQLYLIKKDGNEFRWATSSDAGHAKQFLMPALSCSESDVAGNWKKAFHARDYVLDIDNKSITHRPDLWSHRGIAREIAAFSKLPFKSVDQYLAQLPVESFESGNQLTVKTPISLAIRDINHCKRLAALYISSVENKPSLAKQAIRLTLIDAKPINALVDATNYVMFDIGQPMHAFDAQTIPSKKIIARHAMPGESLKLLDGTDIKLDAHDMVIADEKKPLALAGIMGGAATAITRDSKSVILEAACFDAPAIRHAALRHKIRTEASARFEKTLDPNQNIMAIQRYVHLLREAGIKATIEGTIISLGRESEPRVLTMSHAYIEKKLGTSIPESFITQTSERLGFTLKKIDQEYRITIPTWRATKDLTINEDFVEEIGRMYGYSSINAILPYKQVAVTDLTPVLRRRMIKQHLAFALNMHEISSYALFDEHFLRDLNWEPDRAVTIKNPVSEHWRRLVTSLVPHLLKAITVNGAQYDSLRFFELARTWHLDETINEKKSIAGIFFEKKKALDFYHAKNELSSLFDLMKLPVAWSQESNPPFVWYKPYQTARLLVDGNTLGFAGKINGSFLHNLIEGDAFIFELDADFLLKYQQLGVHYTVPSKYPSVNRDISMLISRDLTVDDLIKRIKDIDPMMSDVALVDFFEKKEWGNERSLTFRFVLSDATKTLTKDEVDAVHEKVVTMLRTAGATIR